MKTSISFGPLTQLIGWSLCRCTNSLGLLVTSNCMAWSSTTEQNNNGRNDHRVNFSIKEHNLWGHLDTQALWLLVKYTSTPWTSLPFMRCMLRATASKTLLSLHITYCTVWILVLQLLFFKAIVYIVSYSVFFVNTCMDTSDM